MTPQPQQHYSNLTMEQLRGADYAFRLLRTSVVIRGEALKVLDDQISEVREEMTRSRPAPSPCVQCITLASRPAPSPCVQCLEEDRVSMMEHDAAIAAQAREKVLDEIRERLWEKAFPPFGSSPEYQIIIWDTVKDVIKSLRTGGEP